MSDKNAEIQFWKGVKLLAESQILEIENCYRTDQGAAQLHCEAVKSLQRQRQHESSCVTAKKIASSLGFHINPC